MKLRNDILGIRFLLQHGSAFVFACLLLYILVSLVAVNAESGTYSTYYVDGTSGNDSNTGSSDNPWKTLGHATATIEGGDTVIVRGGIYRIEEIRFGPAGENTEHRTIFKAATGERVLLTQSDNFPPWIFMDDYVRVEGLWIGGTWDRNPDGAQGGFFQPGGGPIGHGKEIINNTIFGYRTAINIGSSEHLIIQGNRFVRTGYANHDHGIYVAGGGPVGSKSNHIIIDSNTFVVGEGYGIHGWHGPKTTIVTRNFVGRRTAGIVMGAEDAYDHLIANNIIWKTYPGSQLEGEPIYFVNNIHGPNTNSQNRGQGNLTMLHNVFIKPVPDGNANGEDAIVLESDEVKSAIGASETEIDAAIDALDTIFGKSIEEIYADTSAEAHFQFLENLSSLANGPLAGKGIKWFDGGGSFELGVNVPAPSSQDAFWVAFRALGLKEYDRFGNVITNTTPTPTPTQEPTDPDQGGNTECPNGESAIPREDKAPNAPQNICVYSRQGQPLIEWKDDVNAQWFNLYIIGPNGFLPVNNIWYSKPGAVATTSDLSRVICNNHICSLSLPQSFALVGGGEFTVWMQAWGTPNGNIANGLFSKGGVAHVGNQVFEAFNTATFSIPTTRPSQPEGMTVTVGVTDTSDNAGRTRFNWRAADGVTWYQLWIGNEQEGNSLHFQDWLFAEDLGCINRGSSCTYLLPNSLSSGLTQLPTGTFEVWLNSWGPAGYAQTQSSLPAGWAKIASFQVE